MEGYSLDPRMRLHLDAFLKQLDGIVDILWAPHDTYRECIPAKYYGESDQRAPWVWDRLPS
jgi:hypothetical protein